MLKRACALLALAFAVWMAASTVTTVLAGVPERSNAQAGTVVRIQPEAGAYRVGETLTVSVRIEDVVDLYGADIRLAFDPARLQVVEAAVVPSTELLSPPWMIAFNQVANQTGTITYVVTLLGQPYPVSGSGALFSFHFRTLAPGPAAVGISEQTLSDKDGFLIPATTAGATYQVGYQVFFPLVIRAF